jgi:hypothetical protein
MNPLQILLDYLTKTLGKSNEEVQAILYKKADDGTLTDQISESALHDLEDLHAQHLNTAPADKLRAEYDRGHQTGTFDAKSKIQAQIKKVHGIEAKDAESAIAALALKAANDASSEDKVKTHPVYLNAISTLEAQLETERQESTAKLQAVETQAARKERFATQLPNFEVWLKEAGAVLPTNPTAAATLKRLFVEQVQQFDIDPQETGTYLKKADGTLEKDKHGNPIKLETYVKTKATEYFDIQKQEARQSPGNDAQGTPPAPSTEWSEKNLPKTTDEFNAAYYKMPAGEERTKFAVAFEQSQSRQPG